MKEELLEEKVISKIYLVQGEKVMLDQDLAEMYGVETKYLKRQVRRNIERFPEDFMFELSKDQFANLRSQIGTSSWGGTRYSPMAFTEQGVAMLSGVLNSPKAIEVNIKIIRVFIKMRDILLDHKEILLKLEKTDQKMKQYDEDIDTIFTYLKKLLNPSNPPRKGIGYKRKDEE
ncbi:MAG: ORF6N domain-containing protein [Flavobacteriales bacterium]|nr:ORF6N domain-containing protein [Flavobacteriales bacterium]